ncbi:ankyrin repeat [Fusarium heterosporum]|uniref:Ankyrin repeat n=1 Tax=Fusarium heterosporum TaxID=42747 RepID=A0A8H5TZ28_FUSHE|nr:ankyrin repeat [Fusarium heterosporum]
MIPRLPAEILCMIVDICPRSSQASLSRCCRHLYGISNPVLYRNDVQYFDSSAVFHAIAWCTCQDISLRILSSAKAGGATFRACRDAKNYHPAFVSRTKSSLHSPIHLAARRGLDKIIIFLMQHGISPDGPQMEDGLSQVRKPPLAEAICFKRESTAMLLVQSGASIFYPQFQFNAIEDAVRCGLSKLLGLMIELFQIDINEDLGYGCSMIMLAIYHGQRDIVRQLLTLGAKLLVALRHFSQNHQFMALSWTLSVVAEGLTRFLWIEGVLDLMTHLVAQRPSPTQKTQQLEALARLLEVLRKANYASCPESMIPTEELNWFLDALLERALSVKLADAALATLLLRHGARLRAGVFLKLLEILNSETFADNSVRSLRRYPKLLQSFDFVYDYCLSIPASQPTFMMKYFLKAVPIEAIRLVYDLKRQGLPLTAKGLQDLSSEGFQDP